MPDPLVVVYRKEGRRFADALRRLLPITMGTDKAAADRARAELRIIANQTSLRLKKSSAAWVTKELPRLVEGGQRRALQQIKVKFGGVNMQLVERMAREISPRLAEAAESVNPYLSKALRKATALAVLREDSADTDLGGFELKVNKSLLAGALERDNLRQATRRLMADLGLDNGDSVLLLSGRQIQADKYAATVARTRRADAENQAAAFEYEQNGYQFIETSSHKDVDEDDICYFLQGKVWALTPNDQGIPLLPPEYGLPPWHPNCRHTFGAWIPDLNGGQRAIDRVVDGHEDDDETLEAFDGKTKK